MNLEKFNQIFKELKDYCEKEDLEIYDKDLLHETVKLYLAETDLKKEVKKEVSEEKPKGKPATDKQINFLKKLGYKGQTKGLTSFEANQLIKEYKNKPQFEEEDY